jgi:transcription initiation factor IIE alpha subunit
MSEPQHLARMPNHMKTLVDDLLQMMLTAFYEDSDFCVMDLLLNSNEMDPLSPCRYIYDDDANAIGKQIDKKMEQKPVRRILQKLSKAGIIAVEKFANPNRPGSKICHYYYFDRQHFFFSTLYRIHQFNQRLLAMSQKSSTKTRLKVCPNHLDKKYDELDCIANQDQYLDRLPRCTLCETQLIPVAQSNTDRTSKRKEAYSMARRDTTNMLNVLDQIHDEYKNGKRLTSVRPSVYLQQMYDAERVRKEDVNRKKKYLKSLMEQGGGGAEGEDEGGGIGSASAGYNDASLAFSKTSRGLNVQGQEFGVKFEEDEEGEEGGSQKNGGGSGGSGGSGSGSSSSSSSSGSSGSRKRPREEEEEEERDATGRVLPEHFRTGGVVERGGGGGEKKLRMIVKESDEESDEEGKDTVDGGSVEEEKEEEEYVSTDAPVGATEIVVADGEEGEEEEEEEEEEEGDTVTITVNGQVKLLKDVTDEDQANMTEQERETWAELIGIDDY